MSAAPKKAGLSLYANLLEPDKQKQSGATISGAPVRYDSKRQADDAEEQKKKDASLQFQPIRRPQGPAKVNRPTAAKRGGGAGHGFSSSTTSASVAPTSTSSPHKQTPLTSTPSQQPPEVQHSNFNDWVGDEEDDFYYDSRQNRERGGKKNKKKRNKGGGQREPSRAWDWDDIYDPTLPNNYADYKGSEEQYREIRDWKARLYYHQLKDAKKKNGMPRSEEEDERPTMNKMFAPPPSLSFAPPSFDDAPSRPPPTDDDDEYYPPSISSRPPNTSDSYDPPASFAPAAVPDDATGEDAYARRMRLSSAAQPQPPADPRLQQRPTPPVPAPTTAPTAPDAAKAATDIAAKKAEAAVKLAAFKARIEAQQAAKASNAAVTASPTPPTTTGAASPAAPVLAPALDQPQPSPLPPPAEVQETGASISRAPVRYQLPSAPADMPASVNDDVDMTEDQSEDAPRTNRPGQKGFAERLLKKYGWEKGKGLGVQGNEGITTAIVAKAEKRKKLPDAEGGGWRAPANMGKIVGGKKRKIAAEGQDGSAAAQVEGDGDDGGKGEAQQAQPNYGPLSEVIKLDNMLTGLDVDDEIVNRDLYGEIGKEMETQYGSVERLFIWRKDLTTHPSDSGDGAANDQVFVKFVSQLSALRAVGACDGMEFAGNVVKARFFDAEAFEKGVYGSE